MLLLLFRSILLLLLLLLAAASDSKSCNSALGPLAFAAPTVLMRTRAASRTTTAMERADN
jgi:hypothetical protein